MKTNSSPEAAYRLMRNPKVTIESVLEPHIAQKATIMTEINSPIVIAHHTTEFCFRRNVELDGLLRLVGDRQGFFGHFALALTLRVDNFRPLGAWSTCIDFDGRDLRMTTHGPPHAGPCRQIRFFWPWLSMAFLVT
jgi:hypothetical protein